VALTFLFPLKENGVSVHSREEMRPGLGKSLGRGADAALTADLGTCPARLSGRGSRACGGCVLYVSHMLDFRSFIRERRYGDQDGSQRGCGRQQYPIHISCPHGAISKLDEHDRINYTGNQNRNIDALHDFRVVLRI
jgi:hypothetical protein